MTRAAAPGSQPPVFFADPQDLARDLIVLAGPEGRHAADVRRLAVGERADLTDGDGQVAECVVTRVQRGQLELAVRHRTVLPAPDPALAVVQAIPKGERGQLAVELMTEAGVDVIVPWAAERCVARWQGERGERAVARWRSTAREAAKQARRGRVPEVTAPAGLGEVTARVGRAARAFILDPQAGRPAQRDAAAPVGRDARDRRPGGRPHPRRSRRAHPGGGHRGAAGADRAPHLIRRDGGGRDPAQPGWPLGLSQGRPGRPQRRPPA